MAGAIGSAFVFIEMLGFSKTLSLAAALNAVIAVAAVAVAFGRRQSTTLAASGSTCPHSEKLAESAASQLHDAAAAVYIRFGESGDGSRLDPAIYPHPWAGGVFVRGDAGCVPGRYRGGLTRISNLGPEQRRWESRLCRRSSDHYWRVPARFYRCWQRTRSPTRA